MNLTRVELQDVGPFGRFAADLGGSVIGVVGSNGSGKSTLLRALLLAVTGDASRLGRRDAVAAHRAADRPLVRLTFHPGDRAPDAAVVTRWLPADKKDAAHRLSRGGEAWTAAADVAAKFDAWLGVPAKVLADFVFVDQGRMADVVSDQPARRAEVLHRLVGLDAAEAAREACRAHLDALPVPADAAALAALRAESARAAAALREAEAELAAMPAPDPAALAAAEAALAAAAAEADYRRRAEPHRAALAAAEHAAAAAVTPDADPGDLAAAETVAAAWAAYRQADDAVDAADRAVWAADRDAAAVAAGEPPDPGPAPAPPSELVTLEARRDALERLAAAAAGDPCPVCAAALPPTVPVGAAARADLDRLGGLAAAHAAAVFSHQAARDHYRAWRTRADEARRRCAEAAEAAARARAARPPAPDFPEADARAVVEDLKVQRRRHRDGANARTVAANAAASARRALAALGPEPRPVDPAAAAAARAVQTEAARLAGLRHGLGRRVASLREAAAGVDEALLAAATAAARAGRLSGWRKTVEGARAVLHRDAAPAATAAAALAALSGSLNARLAELAAPFRVAVAADGALTAEFRDGTRTTKLAAGRLSGGQAWVLSLAWRIALLDRYAPGVGLLCLDEPTHGLDGRRVLALRDALAAWRPHAGGRQFVVVTHDRRLLPAFDRVIDLDDRPGP